MKVEFYDNDGIRHSISVDGPVTKEKVGKILDLVEVMSGIPSTTSLGLSPRKIDRLASTVLSHLKGRAFTSSEAKKNFEEVFREGIPLSTVSTYLTRLVDRGILEREESGALMHYRVRSAEQLPSLRLQASSRPS